ncbi:MAG: hypothetical protein RIQ52_1240 [Pseudomonadota bacterium]
MPAWVLTVALPLPLWNCFDYLAPDPCDISNIRPGCRLTVPFGKRQMTAYVISVRPFSAAEPAVELKTILAILDPEALICEQDLKLLFWACEYYHHPPGLVIECAFPAWLRKGKDSGCLPALKSPISPETTGPVLNDDQRAILGAMEPGLRQFCVWLLEGVTGSGKTEIYLHLAAKMLAAGQQVMILVPEISLTPQLEARIRARFPVCTAIQHSAVSEKKKASAWNAARNGQARLVVGTRSAIWTPMPQLGLIIIDEEHDTSFKQQEGFRYSARDVAIMRARQLGIPILLGSATPSLESLHNVLRGRYRHCQLPQRTGNSRPPDFGIIDLRQHRTRQAGMSPPLMQAVRETLAAGQQVLLFINRRGYAPVLICDECGWIVECPHCDTPQVLHARDACMRCHHCGHTGNIPAACGACHGHSLYPLGLGTEQVEKILAGIFPDIEIFRIDRDSTRRKGQLDKVLDQVTQGMPCIMIGTQMLAKGHHLPAVTLVGILDMDGGFFSVDFRATERMAQTIIQVAGRAGRGEQPGRVLIQTRHPQHPLLRQLVHEGYSAFARSEIQLREAAGLPPWTYQVLWRCDARGEEEASAWLMRLRQAGEAMAPQLTWWGPAPSPLPRMAGRYRAQLLLQCSHRSPLHQCIHALIPMLLAWPETRRIRWSIDVDPADLR